MAYKKKKRLIVCAECGIEVIATHNKTKFCPECSARRNMESIRRSNERRRLERMQNDVEPEEPIHLCDSPERIQKCLNCTKPDCNNCFGGAKGANVSRPRKPMVLLKNIKTDLVQAIKRGDSNKQICSQFNIGPQTLCRWVRQLKEEGVLE